MSKKKSNLAPEWATPDVGSRFGFVYVSLVQSEQFNRLPCAAKVFYFDCVAQLHDSTAHAALMYHIREDLELCGETQATITTRLKEIGDYKNGYFVFPANHMEKYGYARSTGTNLMKTLIEAGFVEKVEENQHRWKINVYKFSSKWKGIIYQKDSRSHIKKNIVSK